MKMVDDILEVLQDGEWHDIEEVKKKCETVLGVPETKIEIALRFLEEYEFVEKDAEGNRIRAVELYMNFLRKIRWLEQLEVASATKNLKRAVSTRNMGVNHGKEGSASRS